MKKNVDKRMYKMYIVSRCWERAKELPQTEELLRESMLDTIELLDRKKENITLVMFYDNNIRFSNLVNL